MARERANDSVRATAGAGKRGIRSLAGFYGAALSLLLFATTGCGSGDGGAGEKPGSPGITEDPSRDFTTFDVRWREDAVVLNTLSEVQRTLVRADYEAGELVFSNDFAGLEQLEVGRSALIGGVGIFRVLGREDVEDGVLVSVEPGVLTDVVEEGTIAWRRSFVSAANDERLGLGIGEDEADSIRTLREPLGSYQGGTLEYKGNIAGFETTFKLEPVENGLDFVATSKQDAAGSSIASAVVKGKLRGLTNETSIVISARTLSTFAVRFLDVDGEVEIEAGAVELGILDTKVEIPARLSLPFLVGGIPFRVDLGGSIEWASTLQTTCSAIFRGRATFKGGVGARLEDGEVTPLATFERAEVEMGKREHVGTIEAGLGLVMSFPELAVGLGTPKKVAAAEALFRFKTEAISNFSLEYGAAGPAPVITGNCMTSRTNFGATLSGELSMLGLTLAAREVPLFSKFGEEKKSGNACD